MDNAMEFMNNLSGNITGGINSCMMGKIEKFDGKTMKADVVPLVRTKNKAGEIEEVSMLIEVPVSFLKAGPFLIRPPYKEGDIVLMIFADSDIENVLLSGNVSNPNSSRRHSLDDAIVVGSIMPFTTTLPEEHLNDLIIAKDDFTSKIVIKENGDIVIQGGKIYLGSADAKEAVPLGNKLKSWLDNHTHSYNWSDSSGNGVTKAPDSSSPKPSEVVKTI